MPDLESPSAGLEPIERASVDELRALQLERLRWSLRHAYAKVPHYRAAFDAAGVHPDDCKELADLAKFPLTSKADLRDNYPFGMFAVPREQVVRVHASSGTTGRATVVGYTREDIDVWATVMARSIRAAGGRPGHILHNAYGYGLFTGGLGAHYGAEKLGCTVVPVSGGMTERQVTLIRDFRPDIIMVTPSYMLAIVDEMERQGDDPAASSLRFGIFGAEPWTNEMRAEMEARLGIDATDIYGLSEVMGPGVAQECVETKDGLHVWEDHFYPEVIDPETGRVLPDGPGHRLRDLEREQLLRPVGADQADAFPYRRVRVAVPVDQLGPAGRLVVHHVRVGQVRDGQQWSGRAVPAAGQAAAEQVRPHRVLLALRRRQRSVTAGACFGRDQSLPGGGDRRT